MENHIVNHTWPPHHKGPTINTSTERWIFEWLQKKGTWLLGLEEEAEVDEKDISQRDQGWPTIRELDESGHRLVEKRWKQVGIQKVLHIHNIRFSRIMDDANMEYKKLKTTQLNIKRIKKKSKRMGGKH